MRLVPLQAMPLPVGVVFGLGGLALLGLAARDSWMVIRYRTRRPVPVGELSDDADRVVVSGVARRADEVVRAPLSGEECLAYAWRVAELQTQRRFDSEIGRWGRRGRSGRGAVPFLVEDGTGSVLVDPDGAEFRLAEEWVRDPVDVPDDRPSAVDRADDLLGIGTHDRRYYESRLDDGETVTVRGRVGPGGERFVARQVGVSITGGGTLVADATPTAAAGRALRRAALSAGTGLFVLVVVGVFVLVPSL